MIFKSKLRRKAERLYSDKIYRRCDINKELKTVDISEFDEYNILSSEDNKLRIEINLLDELLRK